jgi:ATP-dependent protease Clp ATPase subunit
MFDIPTQKNLEEVVINKKVVQGQTEPLKIFSEETPAKGKKAS